LLPAKAPPQSCQNGPIFRCHRQFAEKLGAIVVLYLNPPEHALVLSVDKNYSTHKHERVQRWLKLHKRFHVCFTPTSSSWSNMIERFFRDLTQNRLRRGIFRDLEQLIIAIGNYIDVHNQNPKPLIWTAKTSDILE
jgi:transposase